MKNENTNVFKQSNFRYWNFIFCCWNGHFALFCTKKVSADTRWGSPGCIFSLCMYLFGKLFNLNFWIIYLNLKLIQRDSKCERERRNESGTRVTSRNRQPSLPGYHQHPPNYQYHHNYVKGTD